MTTQADYKGGFKDFFKLFIAGDVPYGIYFVLKFRLFIIVECFRCCFKDHGGVMLMIL